MKRLVLILGTLLLAVGTTETAAASEFGRVVAEPHTQATGDVPLWNDGASSLLFRPEQLGFTRLGGFGFGRAIGDDFDATDITSSTIHWQRVSRSSSTGFAMDLRELVPKTESSETNRGRFVRAGWGYGRPVGSPRYSFGLTLGGEYVDSNDGPDVQGFSVVGVGARPWSSWQFTQNVFVRSGERPDTAVSGIETTWGTNTQVRWTNSDLGVTTALDLRTRTTPGSSDLESTVHWGAGFDPTVLVADIEWTRMLRGSRILFGIQPDGVNYGLQLRFRNTSIGLAHVERVDHSFTVIGIRQGWGQTWGPGERIAYDETTTTLSDDRTAARSEIRAGRFDAARTRLQRHLGSNLSADDRGELESELEDLDDLIETRTVADSLYVSPDDFDRAGIMYTRLATRAPESELLRTRRDVCQLLMNARNARIEQDERNAWRSLRRALEKDPEHDVVKAWMLELSDYATIDLTCPPLQATLHHRYRSDSPVRLRINHTYPFPVDSLSVEWELPGYLAGTKRHMTLEGVPADDDREIAVPLHLDPAAMAEIPESENLVLVADVTLHAGSGARSFRTARDVTLHGPRVLDWSEPRQFGASISMSPTDLGRLLAAIPADLDPNVSAWTPRLPESVVVAFGMFHLLQLSEVDYAQDKDVIPLGPDDPVYDRLRTPADLLNSKVGDCEDLVALWLAVLEARGIDARYVVERRFQGHVMFMFDTQIPPTRSRRLCGLEEYTVERDGSLWLPVEATTLEGSFVDAVRSGYKFLTNPKLDESREEYSLREVRSVFPPTTWPNEGLSPEVEKQAIRQAVRGAFEHERDSIACDLDSLGGVVPPPPDPPAFSCSDLVDLDGSGDDNDCLLALGIGLELAVNGELERARPYFLHALDCAGTRAAAVCNLGNLALLVDEQPHLAIELYQCASELDPDDDRILVNESLARGFLASRGDATKSPEIQRLADAIKAALTPEEVFASIGVRSRASRPEVTSSEAEAFPDAVLYLRTLLLDREEDRAPHATTALPMGEEDELVYWKEFDPMP